MQMAAAYTGGGRDLGWIHRGGHQDNCAIKSHGKDILPPCA